MPSRSATLTALAVLTACAFVPGSAEAAPHGIKRGEFVAGMCDTITKNGTCREIVVTKEASKPAGLKVLRRDCPNAKAKGICPAAKQIGSCRVMREIILHYYSKGGKAWTVDRARKACEQAGTWVEERGLLDE